MEIQQALSYQSELNKAYSRQGLSSKMRRQIFTQDSTSPYFCPHLMTKFALFCGIMRARMCFWQTFQNWQILLISPTFRLWFLWMEKCSLAGLTSTGYILLKEAKVSMWCTVVPFWADYSLVCISFIMTDPNWWVPLGSHPVNQPFKGTNCG